MKNYLLLIFLFGGFCSSLGDSEELGSWINNWLKDEGSDHIDRPCSIKDINCIRRFFAQHSHCNVAHGLVPDPFLIKQVIFPFAVANLTFVMNDYEVRGLNGKITSFYVNKKTKNLVMEMEIRDSTYYSPNTTIRYHRKGKEPITLTDAFLINFSLLTFTTIIPNYNKLQLSNAEVYAFVDDSNPTFAAGPNFIKSLDPVVIRSFNKFMANIPECAKEAYMGLGPTMISTFIQSSICDFGLNLV